VGCGVAMMKVLQFVNLPSFYFRAVWLDSLDAGRARFLKFALLYCEATIRLVVGNTNEAAPLVGMSLLYGYRIQLDAIEGGAVTIQSLRSLN
jgi:hypothetical protein